MKLIEHKAIVLHWDAGEPKRGAIDRLINWMKNDRLDGAFYHRFVSGSEIVYGRSTNERCIHCGNNSYTMEATAFFGAYYCPPWDHERIPHESSPNNCTLGICMLHDHPGGGYSGLTLDTAAKLVSRLLVDYDLCLDAVWTHTGIVGEKTKLCPRAFYKAPYQYEYFIERLKEHRGVA